MPSITRNISNAIIPTSVVLGAVVSSGISEERYAVEAYEAMAKLHYESRPSWHSDTDRNEDFEFAALPLVQSRVVRIKFRHVGQLPAMSMQDEVVEDA